MRLALDLIADVALSANTAETNAKLLCSSIACGTTLDSPMVRDISITILDLEAATNALKSALKLHNERKL